MVLMLLWTIIRFKVRPGGINRLDESEFPENSLEIVNTVRDIIDLVGN
jgi:hypothetical protein